jgi:branched-chain amino acid transport system permease protein
MSDFLQIVFAGLSTGAAYSLVAVGFGIVYMGTRAINFAQGEYVMVAGVSAGAINEATHWPLVLTIAIVVAGCVLIGILTEVVAVRMLRRPDAATITVATIGLAIAIKSIVLLVSHRETFSLPAFSGNTPLHVGGAALQPQTLWNVGLVIAAAVALSLFFRYTRRGVSMRAAADDRIMAGALGVSYRGATMWTFGLAAGLAAIAGAGLTPVTLMSYAQGTLLGLKGFAAAMLGGLGSMTGAIVGGFSLGIAEALMSGYVSSAYADVVAFAILLAVLFTRPTGIFKQVSVERV